MDTPAVHDRNAEQAAYWNGPAGQRWIGQQETLDIVLKPVSKILFDRARVAEGERVIDVGCGCGATTFELARRVGRNGRVLAVDISAPMLARARERAPANLPLDFVAVDATVHPFERGGADLLFSRFGVMFFAEPELSFANMRAALRRGGRMVFACWREPRKNPWMILPLQEAYKHVPLEPLASEIPFTRFCPWLSRGSQRARREQLFPRSTSALLPSVLFKRRYPGHTRARCCHLPDLQFLR